MTVAAIETLHCDAGWRDYHFLKLTAADGTVGWSEFDEGFSSPGVSAVIERLVPRMIGQQLVAHERLFTDLFAATKQSAGGVVAQALGAIENALLDAKAKRLGVPCHVLFGGALRERIRVYWSHCATWRINFPEFYPPAITDLDGVRAIGEEARRRGFTALKTNIFLYEAEGTNPRLWMPGFAVPFEPGLNVERVIVDDLRRHLGALREGAGPDMDILLDLNFNARAEGYIQALRGLADLGLFWVEIDSLNPEALADVRRHATMPISSCETLLGLRQFLPYFKSRAMDVAIIDGVWNGMWQSLKIAAAAEAHEINVAPHNYYGHLSTMMNAHWAAAVPNLRIMEVDVDRLSWDDELYDSVPEIVHGHLRLPDRPGWGIEPVEAAIRARPARGRTMGLQGDGPEG
ncbi:MAG TPA: mandelate racemase/muconate lactonizing enzyme family protein [Alphaproteobacteria bacterium]|jgi:L-alanine-DL-glutamate epimerase-like enolase superfamily enzyme|nr:mandelate racemase/muconate lactonizing enzyme family protein [Alphaproteobacteria bacterium]